MLLICINKKLQSSIINKQSTISYMFTIKQFTFSPVQENTYVLYNENKNAIIIDPGCYYKTEEATLKNFIEEKELTVKMLLNTHCHLDHVFGNKFIFDTYKTILKIHKNEELMLKYAPQAGEKWDLPFINYDAELEFLEEGETIFLDADELHIIAAPGHSPGHLCFYCKKQNFVIGGDVLFYESIGRTDLPMCNHDELLKNIKEKLFVLPDETIVYAGHGQHTNIAHEKKFNLFLQ